VKVSDSGMPEEALWERLLDAELILDRLGVGGDLGDVAELGCGFGTFTVPVASRVSGTVYAYDVDEAMTARTRERAACAGAGNVIVEHRDVLAKGFGLPPRSLEGCLLFNILHHEDPTEILSLAASAVRPGGRLFVIHWRYDRATPRGPDLAIRPRPDDVAVWAASTGALELDGHALDLPPWHYGLVLRVRP
jgi:SAM-dependent methyltransferase